MIKLTDDQLKAAADSIDFAKLTTADQFIAAVGRAAIAEHCRLNELAEQTPLHIVGWAELGDTDRWYVYSKESDSDTFDHINRHQKDQHFVTLFPVLAR